MSAPEGERFEKVSFRSSSRPTTDVLREPPPSNRMWSRPTFHTTGYKPKDEDRLVIDLIGEIFVKDDRPQEPPHESGLQTPQPDQRMPTEQERRDEDTKVTRTTEVTEVVEEK
jgi:hypothetical protein